VWGGTRTELKEDGQRGCGTTGRKGVLLLWNGKMNRQRLRDVETQLHLKEKREGREKVREEGMKKNVGRRLKYLRAAKKTPVETA